MSTLKEIGYPCYNAAIDTTRLLKVLSNTDFTKEKDDDICRHCNYCNNMKTGRLATPDKEVTHTKLV